MKVMRLQNGKLTTVQNGAPSNFILNASPSKDVTGWNTYADAAGTAPVDGTGGSPTVTWTRTTSSPLSETASFLFTKDAANRQGQGVSYDFTINRADQAKVCRIDFDYEVASGTYADGDLTVWLYDVTNGGAPIQPSASSILNAIGPQKKQPLSFQTNSNSTSYRLIIHVASTSASAYTVKFDNVSVTRESVSQGTVARDTITFTPTGTWTSNVTYYGKVSGCGEYADYDMTVHCSGTPNSAALKFNLYPGHVIDTSKLSGRSGVIEDGFSLLDSVVTVLDSGIATYFGAVMFTSTTQVAVNIGNASGAYDSNAGVTQAVPITFGANDAVNIKFRVPIVGWSSSQQLSSDADTRVVEFQATKITSTQNVSAGSATVVILNNIRKDSHGGFASNKYTVQVPGSYDFRYSLYVAMGATAATIVETWIRVNGGSVKYGYCYLSDLANTKTYTFSNFAQLELKARDEVEVIIQATTQSVTVGASPDDAAQFTGYKVGGPAQIAASAIVSAKRFSSATSLTYNTTTPIAWTTSEYDSHGGFITSTIYKCPVPGRYQVTARYNGASQAASATDRILALYVRVNGVNKATGPIDRAFSTSSREYIGTVTVTINCNAGDEIDVAGFTNIVTSTSTSNNGAGVLENYVCIDKVGGTN